MNSKTKYDCIQGLVLKVKLRVVERKLHLNIQICRSPFVTGTNFVLVTKYSLFLDK